MIENCVIYCIINNLNGQIYVGQTKNFIKRQSHYIRNHHKNQIKLYNATQKYGWKNFSFEIIEDNISKENLNNREKYWIKHLCAVEFGYNLTYGGQKSEYSYESRMKISERMSGKNNPNYGKKKSITTRQRMSQSQIGSKNHQFGKVGIISHLFGIPKTADIKSKIKESKRHLMQSVKCIQTRIIFESTRECARQMNLHQSSISQYLKGKRNHVSGYTFELVQ